MNKLLIAAAAPAGLALLLAGCSSSDSATSPTPEPTSTSAVPTTVSPTTSPTSTSTTSPTGTPTSTPTEALCSKAEIEAQLPEGSTVERYACAATGSGSGSEYWAAAEVSQGPTVFFLQANDARTKWTQVSIKKEICGTASAGLPAEILAFC